MIEAYIAAAFVDSDFDYSVVENFFTAHVQPYFENMSLYDTFANRHPTVSGIFQRLIHTREAIETNMSDL